LEIWQGPLEGLEVIDRAFWNKKRIFLTGHTGFKGSWLTLWLREMGAEICGYSLNPPTNPSLFELARVNESITDIRADINHFDELKTAVQKFKPEIVLHLAAQPLVRYSYSNPLETYQTNVMGTAHVLEAVRQTPDVRACLIVTTDKCYENKEWTWGYRENDPMGGYDPYSSSKGCAELVTAAYRRSYFSPSKFKEHGVALASARAGNVIGGGDWALDRLVPDIIQSYSKKQVVNIRSPHAIRPWQHVLEPLSGYLTLAQKLYQEGAQFAEAFNFGPSDKDCQSVEMIVEKLTSLWGTGARWQRDPNTQPHEASFLKLDSSKAHQSLNWWPHWKLDEALQQTVQWYKAVLEDSKQAKEITLRQIREYAEKR